MSDDKYKHFIQPSQELVGEKRGPDPFIKDNSNRDILTMALSPEVRELVV